MSEYDDAVASNNIYKANRLRNEISLLAVKENRAKRLIDSTDRYQERQQQKLSSGPRTSLSQIVDESGDCD